MDGKSAQCMDKNGKYNKHTRHISGRVHFVRNGENWKIHKIEWCGGVIQLSDIATKKVGENDLNLRMRYIVVSFDNW